MRSLPLGIALIASPVFAQPNLFEIYPDRAGAATTASSRSLVGAPGGELLQQIPAQHIRGVGCLGGAGGFLPPVCEINGARVVLQDNRAQTQETYAIRVRTGSFTGPDPTPTGLLLSVSLPTPPGTGTVAWSVTVTLACPLRVPCDSEWFLGVLVPSAPAWTADGLSLHTSQHNVGSGDNPRTTYAPPAPSFAWAIEATGLVLHDTDRDWRVGALTDCPVLNVGAIHTGTAPNPNFGVAGMYPDVTFRNDGLSYRVMDRTNVGGDAYALVTSPPSPFFLPPFTFGGIKGSLWLFAPTLALGGGPIAIPPSGEVTIASPWFAPGGLFMVPGVLHHFQALTTGPAFTPPFRLSNAQMTWL